MSWQKFKAEHPLAKCTKAMLCVRTAGLRGLVRSSGLRWLALLLRYMVHVYTRVCVWVHVFHIHMLCIHIIEIYLYM